MVNRNCNSCKQIAEFPCSCCGNNFHHVDCSDRSCEKHWESVEKLRLNQVEELSKQPKSVREEMEEELANLKEYTETRMDKDTTTPQEIKEYIIQCVDFLEREIANKQKTETKTELEERKVSQLTELEKYKPEVFYSRPLNRPSNTSCPHWQQHCQQVISQAVEQVSGKGGSYVLPYKKG